MLKGHYATATRNEFAEIADEVACTILSKLPTLKERPYIIGINGPLNCGKSLFWDVVGAKLLGESAIFVKKNSDSFENDGRMYETWVGNNEEIGPLKLFFWNANAPTPTRLLSGCTLKDNNPYDVMIITNTSLNFEATHSIDMKIDIGVTNGRVDENWDRFVTLKLNGPS